MYKIIFLLHCFFFIFCYKIFAFIYICFYQWNMLQTSSMCQNNWASELSKKLTGCKQTDVSWGNEVGYQKFIVDVVCRQYPLYPYYVVNFRLDIHYRCLHASLTCYNINVNLTLFFTEDWKCQITVYKN